MTSVVYRPATREIGDRRRELAPGIHQAFMEAIWVAAEMRAGGAFAHSTVALHTPMKNGSDGRIRAPVDRARVGPLPSPVRAAGGDPRLVRGHRGVPAAIVVSGLPWVFGAIALTGFALNQSISESRGRAGQEASTGLTSPSRRRSGIRPGARRPSGYPR